jgi:proline iminopeptidase
MYVTVNETRLYFDVEGAGLIPDGPGMSERPVVLLLHGGPGFDHAYFKPFMSELAQTAQLIYLDQRGQGRSGRPPLDTCTMEQMADDAVALCHALGISRPIVLGHSFGGFVALHMAIRHPGSMSQLILVDSAASSEDMAGSMEILEQRHGIEARDAAIRLFSGDTSEAAGMNFSRLVVPAYVRNPTNVGLFAAAVGRTIMNQEMMAYSFSRMGPVYDLRPHLREISVPTLVMVGDYDWLLPPSASRVIASGIRNAELAVLHEAGHMPFIEQPQAFHDTIRQFLTTSSMTVPVG